MCGNEQYNQHDEITEVKCLEILNKIKSFISFGSDYYCILYSHLCDVDVKCLIKTYLLCTVLCRTQTIQSINVTQPQVI